jgi:hypothetical protein
MNLLTPLSLVLLAAVPAFEFFVGTGLLEIPTLGGVFALTATVLLHQRHRLDAGVRNLFATSCALTIYHATYSLFIFESLSYDSRIIFGFSLFSGMAVYFLSYEYTRALRRILTRGDHFLKIFTHYVLVILLLLSLVAFGAIIFLIYQANCCFSF